MLHYFLLLLCSITTASVYAQVDSSAYKVKYAFQPTDPYADLEQGQEFFLANGMYRVWNGKRYYWGFYDETTQEKLTKAKYDTITFRYLNKEKRGFYRIKEKGKWGLLGPDREVWLPVKYDQLNYISKRYEPYISIELAGKYGVLNPKGETILEAVYTDILFDGYRYKVKQGARWGLRDNKGKELIPTCFDEIEDHAYVNQMRVRKGDQWAVYNWVKEDPCALAIHYDDIDYFSKYYVVRAGSKFGLLDINAKEVLAIEYDYMAPFFLKYLNTVIVGQNKKVGLFRIDSTGQKQVEIPIEYDDIWIDENNFKIKVRLGDRIDYYFGDQTLFDLAYNDVQYYEEINRVMVKKKGKWGMLTPEGEEMIPIAYDKIHVMNAKHFMVEKKGKWGLLNGQGREMIPVLYDEFDYRPKKDIFFVNKGGKWGIVSIKKGLLLPPQYEDLYTLPNRNFLVKQKGLWGVAAPGGRVIVPLEHSTYDYKYKSKEIYLKRPDGGVKKYSLY
ncbi:MAG: WG repeat-containing protein [Aureispira sp.]